MCGSNESCADKPWSPNCNNFAGLRCTCGDMPYSCNPTTEVCMVDTSQCTKSKLDEILFPKHCFRQYKKGISC